MNKFRQTILPYYNLCFYALALLTVLVSVALDILTHRQYTLFERSGSVMVFCGTFVAFRHQFRRGLAGMEDDDSVTGHGMPFPDSGNGNAAVKQDNEERIDLASLYHGTILAGIGTIIWGYGDLFLAA